MNQISISHATALLLVVSATTLASDENANLDTKYLAMFYFDKPEDRLDIVFKCSFIERALTYTDAAPQNRKAMLEFLKANTDKHPYVYQLISYVNLNQERICEGIDAESFLWFTSVCKENDHLKPIVEFAKRYAPKKFQRCARKILVSGFDKKSDQTMVEQLVKPLTIVKELFRAGLEIDGKKLSDEKMNKLVKEMDLATAALNVHAMIEVVRECSKIIDNPPKELFSFLKDQCASYRITAWTEVGIINMALALGVLKENELTPRFLMFYGYVLICAQFLDEKTAIRIENKLLKQWHKSRLLGAM